MRVDRNIELKWENMRRGIEAQSRWLRFGAAELHLQARRSLTGPTPPRVYLVGCGDSHYCGLAARLAFERWSGVPTEALESLEFSRYAIESAPAGSWVVCVSNSGRVVRTVESAMFAHEHGLVPVALTFDASSNLASVSEAVLTFGYEDVGFGPGTLSYIASLTGLYAIALHLGERVGKLDRDAISARLGALSALAGTIDATIQACDNAAETLGRDTAPEVGIHIIGGGPNYGTALFGMAKFIESAAMPAVGQELEEWAHEQYFCTGPGTLTVVIAPPGASTDRAREQLHAIRDVDGAAVVVASAADAETLALANQALRVPDSTAEELTPVPYCVPLELFAYHYAMSKGKTMLGFNDKKRMEVNFRQIFGSKLGSSRSTG